MPGSGDFPALFFGRGVLGSELRVQVKFV